MLSRLIGAGLRPIWRMRRGLTLGAQGCILDGDNRVLLVKHGYRPGWHFPGGGVEWGETAEAALARELREETGVELTASPVLHGLFANFAKFPGDHIALYVVRGWRRPVVPAPNSEIAEATFCDLDKPPDDLVAGARRRLNEIVNGTRPASDW